MDGPKDKMLENIALKATAAQFLGPPANSDFL